MKESMTDAMDVDLPFTIDPLTIQLAQTDEYILAVVLLRLAQAKSTSSDTPGFDAINSIKKLGMHDLRPDLASGKYDKVASEVLKRISPSRGGPSVPESDQRAVIKAFKSKYLGNTSVIQKAIDQVIDDRDLYANAIPFVQSSGTGKSKLIQELSKTFFVLMLNLREDDRAGDFSFPRTDVIVRDHLQGDNTVPAGVDANTFWRLRYTAFLCAIFDILITIIQEGIFQPSEFADKFEETRPAYLTQIIDTSKALETTFLDLLAEQHETSDTVAELTYNSLIQSARNFFEELRKKHPSDRPPPLVLALDEAHVMTMTDSRASGSLLNIFSSVLADLKSNPSDIIHFATIFLSTNSDLNKVAPSTAQIASQRLRTKTMAGALTCVPYDVFFNKKKNTWTVADISTLNFISAFGRPLFGALMRHGQLPGDVLTLAKEKLAHAKSPILLDQLKEKQTAYALIGRRIFLHFRPLQSSALTMGSNLIAHHMQVAYVVPIHRNFVVSGSPSEPFLVEAAAHLMATAHFSTISCLLNFMNEDLVDAGESGEIVGRSLTIDAYDIALRSRTVETDRIYHSWVPVLDFLKELFADSVYERIIKTKPFGQPTGPTLEEAFSAAVVRLTHYARLSQLNLFNATNVRKAFLRGMGLVGAQSQQLVDILIPVLFGPGKQHPSTWVVEEGKMSQIMANWKNKAEDATPPHTDPYDTYENLNTKQPTILLWHQFGSKKSEAVLPQTEKAHYPRKRSVYFIDLYGIGPEVYKHITNSNKEKYRQVIGCGDIYRDAPYTFPEYIAAVEHTLPRWSADSFEETVG